jgi:two-component system phosphate regulon sensor histidine kinase PhoR
LYGYSVYQLLRVQKWMAEPEAEPPEARGIWGDLLDTIYHLQRTDREARERLESTVTYLRDSLAAMRDAVVMVDASGAIQWSNRSAERLLGLQYPRDQGQGILNLLRHPTFHEYFDAGQFVRPLVIPHPSDAERVLQVEVTLFGAGNRLVFVRDITAISRLEQVRRDFVANVSHELRTPLTVISGYLATIQDSLPDLDPRLQKPLQQMNQQSRRMEALLRDLLWLSKVEDGRQRSEDEEVDMGGLLAELCSDLRLTHPEAAIALHVDTHRRLRGDYKELHSAVSNLLTNAIKYSPGNPIIEVSWREEHDRLRLSVKDHGIGIDPAHHARLTERFYRVDDSRSTATGGTGLGLAIVKHVAASHDAELVIQSVPGRGSTFTLVFPLHSAVVEPQDDQGAKS